MEGNETRENWPGCICVMYRRPDKKGWVLACLFRSLFRFGPGRDSCDIALILQQVNRAPCMVQRELDQKADYG